MGAAKLPKVLMALALLAGCSVPSGTKSPKCAIPEYTPTRATEGWAAVLAATDFCIWHWSKTYARSKESAGDVADAAVAECADQLRVLSYVSGQPNSGVAPQTPAQLQQSFREDAISSVFRFREAGCR